MVPRVLVVDDEPAIRRFLRTSLSTRMAIPCSKPSTGRKRWPAAAAHRPDLVILDLGLPDMDGVKVVESVREWTQIPIIIVSVRSEDADKIRALDAGADDYLTKPFGVGELLARMRAALRRAASPAGEPVFTLAS